MVSRIIKGFYKYLVNNTKLFTKLQVWRSRNRYPVRVLNSNYIKTYPAIHFIHRYVTSNSGDIACGYYQYFLKEFDQYKCVVHDINSVRFSLIKKDDIVIIGGGGLLNATPEWNYNMNQAARRAKKAIIWSAGFNGKTGKGPKTSIDWNLFNLVAVRDYSYGEFRYVPCATCMMSAMDKSYHIHREIGVVAHKDVLHHLPNEIAKFEMISNNATLDEFTEFIGSSSVIFTNSYHAVYWSILMGKKCVLFAPRSEKYNFYKYPPTLFSGDLSFDISCAVVYPEVLKEARQLTLEFLQDIKFLIEEK